MSSPASRATATAAALSSGWWVRPSARRPRASKLCAPSEAAMLALRLDSGLDLERYAARFGDTAATRVRSALREVEPAHLVRVEGRYARLTARGRLLASEVFVRLLP